MRWRGPAGAAGAVAALLLAGCGGGRAEADPAGEARARLEQQRTDVRAATRGLLVDAERVLPGTTRTSAGRWEGCASAFPEGYRTVRYAATARIDLAPGARVAPPYVGALRRVLDDAGLAAGEPRAGSSGSPGSTSVGGARPGVSAVFTHTGAGAFVVLDVAGPCLEVPPGEREEWVARPEPASEVR